MNLAASFLGIDLQGWITIAIDTFIGIALLGLGYRLQKKPKTLDYAISSTQDLTTQASPHVQTRLEFIWTEGSLEDKEVRPLKAPRIVNYRIANTGKRAIDADDFKRPIELSVAMGSIVDVVVTRVSHPGILELGSIPRGESSTRRVFTPVLLNPKYWIDIQVITDGCPTPPKLTSWIREESRPMQRRQEILDPPVREVLKRQRESKARWYDLLIALLVLLWILGSLAQR
jgi:hypothetical protein